MKPFLVYHDKNKIYLEKSTNTMSNEYLSGRVEVVHFYDNKTAAIDRVALLRVLTHLPFVDRT